MTGTSGAPTSAASRSAPYPPIDHLPHAFSGLLQESKNPRLAPVGHAVSLFDRCLLLNPADYPVTWFKGGSTPGVLAWSFLVKAADGTVLVTSVLLSGSHDLDGSTLSPQVDAIVRGALRPADPQVGSTG